MTQSVSPAVVEYLQQVNAHMRSVCDVSYVEVANGLSGGYGAMAGAIKASKPPSEFIDTLIRDHALARIADKNEGGARQFNVRRAAIAEYARESDSWEMGADGTAYSDNGDGLLRLDVVHSKRHDRWGFGVFAAAAGGMVPNAAEAMGRRSPIPDANFEFFAASNDLGEAGSLAAGRLPRP